MYVLLFIHKALHVSWPAFTRDLCASLLCVGPGVSCQSIYQGSRSSKSSPTLLKSVCNFGIRCHDQHRLCHRVQFALHADSSTKQQGHPSAQCTKLIINMYLFAEGRELPTYKVCGTWRMIKATDAHLEPGNSAAVLGILRTTGEDGIFTRMVTHASILQRQDNKVPAGVSHMSLPSSYKCWGNCWR